MNISISASLSLQRKTAIKAAIRNSVRSPTFLVHSAHRPNTSFLSHQDFFLSAFSKLYIIICLHFTIYYLYGLGFFFHFFFFFSPLAYTSLLPFLTASFLLNFPLYQRQIIIHYEFFSLTKQCIPKSFSFYSNISF